MLAPDDASDVSEYMVELYKDISASDKVAYMIQTMQIYPVTKNNRWLNDLSKTLGVLYPIGDKWSETRLSIVSDMLSAFVTYEATFKVVAKRLASAKNVNEFNSMLDKLIEGAETNLKNAHNAKITFAKYLDYIHNQLTVIDDGISSGWKHIEQTEGEILELAEKIYNLQSEVLKIEQATQLNSLNSITVTDIKDTYTQTASICYSMVVDGLSVSYLSVGLLCFSFEKMIADMVKNVSTYEKNMKELMNFSQKYNVEQKALAQTKAVIHLLYSLQIEAAKQHNSLNYLETFWKNERRNLLTIRDAINFTKSFSSGYAEIMQLPVAASVWKLLSVEANQVLVAMAQNNVGTKENNRIEIKI